MSLNTWPHQCPACGSEAIRELFRIESDPGLQPGGDLAVYACQSEDCGEEFDSDDPRVPALVKP